MSSPVLLLDAAWRVDRVIGAEHACELLLAGQATSASEDLAAVFRSQMLTVEVPSVVARTGSVRFTGSRMVACNPRRVKLRDEHRCQFVENGVPCPERGDTIDHLLPRSLGGGSTWLNLVGACRRHNHVKADRTLEEMTRRYGWRLRREPFVPSHAAITVAGLSNRHPAWEPYLVA